ncbi:MAG: oligosaccharide flippase family protein, partial [Patescibacteria group bacterium]
MNLYIKKLWQDKFVRGTFLLTVVSFVASIFSFLVHPVVTRYLTVAEYGDFQALMAFTSLLGIITTVISTTLIREFSVLADKKMAELEILRNKAIKVLFLFGFGVFVLIAFGSNFFSQIFKISESIILLVASIGFLYGFPLVANRAVLTGLQKFPELSLNSFLDSLSRFVLIAFFVAFLPFKLFGASIAFGFSGLVSFLFSFYQIKKINLPK